MASHALLHASLPFPRLCVRLCRGQCANACLLQHRKQVFVVHTLSEVLFEAWDDNEGPQEAGECLEAEKAKGYVTGFQSIKVVPSLASESRVSCDFVKEWQNEAYLSFAEPLQKMEGNFDDPAVSIHAKHNPWVCKIPNMFCNPKW